MNRSFICNCQRNSRLFFPLMRENNLKLPEVHGCHVVSGLRLLCVGKVGCLKTFANVKTLIYSHTNPVSLTPSCLSFCCLFFFLLLMTGVRALAEVIHLQWTSTHWSLLANPDSGDQHYGRVRVRAPPRPPVINHHLESGAGMLRRGAGPCRWYQLWGRMDLPLGLCFFSPGQPRCCSDFTLLPQHRERLALGWCWIIGRSLLSFMPSPKMFLKITNTDSN